jgi:hypothetical protein
MIKFSLAHQVPETTENALIEQIRKKVVHKTGFEIFQGRLTRIKM